MRNAIIATHRLDFPPAAHLQSTLDNGTVFVFDPQLLDRARFEGVPNVQLIRRPSDNSPSDDYRKAGQQASRIEQSIEEVIKKIFPEVVGCRWQYHQLFYMLYTINRYAGLSDCILEQYQDFHFHVPIGDKPFRYGFLSFLPSLLLLERLLGNERPHTAYSYELPAIDPDLVPVEFGAVQGDYDLFVHLPTCFYDSQFFESEIVASGRRSLNFRAQYWDVPLPAVDAVPLRPTDELFGRLDGGLQGQIADALGTIRQLVTRCLKEFLATEDYVARQTDCIVGICRSQMVFYHSLVERFSSARPRKLLLSNHDGGLHGPFLSFAKRFGIPVVFVPHSKIFNGSVPSAGLDVRCLTHPIQGRDIADAQGRRMSSNYMVFPEVMSLSGSHPKRLETVGLILSSISYNGLCGIDLDVYLAGIRKIKAWCADNGVAFRLRCKPTDSFINLLVEDLGFDYEQLVENLQGNILDFAQTCDVCLMYDAPTSGVVDLLRNAIPVLNPVDRPLIPEEERLVSSDLVPREKVEEILGRLDSFLADTNNLFIFRRKQFHSYIEVQSHALPLRMFL